MNEDHEAMLAIHLPHVTAAPTSIVLAGGERCVLTARRTMARILLVDDDDLVRTSCAAALAGRGHVVLQSANGRDAVSALTRTAVDAVILDLLMPDMDG